MAVAAVIDPTVAKPNGDKNQLVEGGEIVQKRLSKLIDVQKVERVSVWDFLDKDSRSRSIIDLLDDLTRMRKACNYPGPNIVIFSHSSVRDYLLQQHDDADLSNSFSFSEDMAHRFIAKSCLALIQDTLETARQRSIRRGLGVPPTVSRKALA